MAPLDRTSSLPLSVSGYLSRLTVFSGRADQDEVSNTTELRRQVSNEERRRNTTDAAPPRASRPWRRSKRLSINKYKPQLSPSRETPNGDDAPKRQSPPASPQFQMLTQSSSNETEPDYDKQASDLIKNALARAKNGGKDKEPKSSRGALAALGLRAAGIGAPQQAAVASSAPSSAAILQPSKPIATPDPAPSPRLPSGASTPAQPSSPAPPPATQLPQTQAPAPQVASALPPHIASAPDHEEQASQDKPLKSQPIRGGIPVEGDPVRSARSPSPFFRARKSREDRRARERDPSPEVQALRKDSATSAAESDTESAADDRGRRLGSRKAQFRPQASAYESPDESGNEADFTDDGPSDMDDDTDFEGDTEEGALDDDVDYFDEETERNTEANAIYDVPGLQSEDRDPDEPLDPNANFDVYGEEIEQDVLGEGPNVVIPPEPMFPTRNQPKIVKSLRSGLDVITSRPTFARDRCTISITQGDPDGALERLDKGMRRYVVLSDLSDESRYAVEWAIGTVARDGDEVFLISVMEDEHKVDPKVWRDQSAKMKVQKERQTQCLLLVRQVTSLLQRTRLNITVTCQALHAKNARYMLLDLIDFLEPTLVIVGSRGLGQLKGILLGSTSHYLVQKSSVPVMVARRRMYRPPRRTNPEKLRHSPRVSLASANIEKTASTKQEDDIADAADDVESAVETK
ncbi:hypothetical protein A1Q1_01598 [Trichosporon asahii var. asahii CBS 2479]|uniref:UspA domain-containing protein n=1 Tax=Trichosporon asahii var. asahii (strain ATCC 90039 / CBS 2479 / JCM 2466 / KCTC 7840 / NBRC 103889/ NCYC 2677 / UAMH 7654) TaxID=1186058 RepID=J5QVB3_TRIAS|nr:hypothetical protein A1Q1_01598 [Trichosporon asahii var. asahii CBS 2479]EJT49298.1 hypothetical protein A1Q1_01598 [Trichosporon asahii var. asahii CBS 2479]